jgi:hypothetical protein
LGTWRAVDMEHPQARCDGCGSNMEPWEQGPVIFDCLHALHAVCAVSRSDACPLCRSAGAEDPPRPSATSATTCSTPRRLGSGRQVHGLQTAGYGPGAVGLERGLGLPGRSWSPFDVNKFGQPKPPMAAGAVPTTPSQHGGKEKFAIIGLQMMGLVIIGLQTCTLLKRPLKCCAFIIIGFLILLITFSQLNTCILT